MSRTSTQNGPAPHNQAPRSLFAINGKLITQRLGILSAIALAVFLFPTVWGPATTALTDAFVQVTVFVGATLAMVFAAERIFAVDLGKLMAKARHMQSVYAALLGALPGCGGAIIVVTQYSRGMISFGSVVSVLIATMGDAAFLLIAREPLTGLLVISVSLVAGSLGGWVVDKIHGPDFMRPEFKEIDPIEEAAPAPRILHGLDILWVGMVVLTIPISIGVALQVDINVWFGPLAQYDPLNIIGVGGGVLSLLIWALKPGWGGQGAHDSANSVQRRVVDDTTFVTAWVVMAFFAYELIVHMTGVDVSLFFGAFTPLMPLVGVLIGFIPGCGPQIVVTTLYLAGAIPLSAQFANSISNDGDALFPAIALVPKAAILATAYSAIPALIVGYGWMILFERG